MAQQAITNLAAIRKCVNMTQRDVAERMGITPSRVGIIENQSNLAVSTLKRYIAALGGTLHVYAQFDNQRIELKID